MNIMNYYRRIKRNKIKVGEVINFFHEYVSYFRKKEYFQSPFLKFSFKIIDI